MRLWLMLIPALTLLLGVATAIAFYAVGGGLALQGPYVLWQSWPLIYVAEGALVAAVLFVTVRLSRNILDLPKVALLVIAAWFGEYLVLASGILADELNPGNAVFYWLLATGGPVQPAAAFVGSWLGLRR